MTADIKMPRWLTDKLAMVLAFHPSVPMKSQAIWRAAVSLGWMGNFHHCRKTLSSLRGPLWIRTGMKWQLTATGLTYQNHILRSMTDVLAMHARTRGAALATPTTAVVYQKNGAGAHVCVGCGSALGMEHTPMCTNGDARA